MIRAAIKLVTVGVVAQKALQKAAVLKPVADVATKQLRKRRAGGHWTQVEPPRDDAAAAVDQPSSPA